MDLRRLRVGEWVTTASGVALLISLFLPWYRDTSGFGALAVIDVLLTLIALGAILLGVVTALQQVPALPIALGALVGLSGILAVLLVLLRVVDLPDAATGREAGLWLALVAAAGIVGGAATAIRDERWPRAPKTEIEGIPAPRP
jgi:hypothetical protein